MIEQRVTLRYGAQQIPAIVQAVQGDTGRDVIFELADYEIPAGATANYYIDKPDGNAVYNSAEVISSTEILAHLTEQALAEPGRNNGQVRILSDGEVITSFDFVLEVEPFYGILRLQSETEINIFDQAIEDAVNTATEEAVAEIQAQTPVVMGMQSSIAPTYSASSTYAVGDYVMYNVKLYKCNTAITTPEAWTPAHWNQVSLADDINDFFNDLHVNVKDSPLNLISWDRLNHTGYINGNNGEFVLGTSGGGLDCCTDYITVEPSTNYRFASISGTNWNIVLYDESKQYISGYSMVGSVDTTADTKYVRLSFKSVDTNYNTQIFSRLAQRPNDISTKLLSHTYEVDRILLRDENLQLGVRDINSPLLISNSTIRCTTIFPLFLTAGTVIKASSQKVGVLLYDVSLNPVNAYGFDTFDTITLQSDYFVNFNFAKPDNSEITTTDFADLAAKVNIFNPTEHYINECLAFSACRYYWRNGSVANINNADGISMGMIAPNNYASSVMFVVNRPLPTGHKYRFQISTFSVNAGDTLLNLSNRITIEKTVVTTNNYYEFKLNDGSIGFALALYEFDENDDYSPLRVSTVDTKQIYILRKYNSDDQPLDYAIGPDMIKQKVEYNGIGTLSAAQSFCKYNGKYYSPDGEKLYVQDQAFAPISVTDMSLGHGNSLQLGHNGKAYASGWNDQKVYEVDLETKTITHTYTLPTTGYTTVAVDDVNGLMYIFQRATYPDTLENYNFIVYDYANAQIISTKKTTVAFGGMQALDFVDGKIFVVNGFGTGEVPNGYRIYNTNCDLIAEYVLGSFATTEPEGICIDRDTHELLISFVNKYLYMIA